MTDKPWRTKAFKDLVDKIQSDKRASPPSQDTGVPEIRPYLPAEQQAATASSQLQESGLPPWLQGAPGKGGKKPKVEPMDFGLADIWAIGQRYEQQQIDTIAKARSGQISPTDAVRKMGGNWYGAIRDLFTAPEQDKRVWVSEIDDQQRISQRIPVDIRERSPIGKLFMSAWEYPKGRVGEIAGSEDPRLRLLARGIDVPLSLFRTGWDTGNGWLWGLILGQKPNSATENAYKLGQEFRRITLQEPVSKRLFGVPYIKAAADFAGSIYGLWWQNMRQEYGQWNDEHLQPALEEVRRQNAEFERWAQDKSPEEILAHKMSWDQDNMILGAKGIDPQVARGAAEIVQATGNLLWVPGMDPPRMSFPNPLTDSEAYANAMAQAQRNKEVAPPYNMELFMRGARRIGTRLTAVDPDFSYTWLLDSDAQEAYRLDKQQVEAQTGQSLGFWQADRLKERHEDPTIEMIGESIFDLTWAIPQAAWDVVFKVGSMPFRLAGRGALEGAKALPIVGDAIKWLTRETTLSVGRRLGFKASEVFGSLFKAANDEQSFMHLVEETANLSNVPPTIGPRQLELMQDLGKQIPIDDWPKVADDAISWATEQAKKRLAASGATEAEIARATPNPVEIVERIADTFEASFIDDALKKLDDRVVSKASEKLGAAANWLRKAWIEQVLSARPGFTVINFIDSSFRMIVMGGNPFADLETIEATTDLPRSLRERFLATEADATLPVGHQPPGGPIGYMTREAGTSVFEDLPWPLGKRPWIRTKSGIEAFEKAHPRLAKMIRVLNMANWSAGWKEFNTAFEYALSARLYHKLYWGKFFELDGRVGEQVLSRVLADDDVVRRLAERIWKEAADNPAQIETLVAEAIHGRQIKGRPMWTLLVPPDVRVALRGLPHEQQQVLIKRTVLNLRDALAKATDDAGRKVAISGVFEELRDAWAKEYDVLRQARSRGSEAIIAKDVLDPHAAARASVGEVSSTLEDDVAQRLSDSLPAGPRYQEAAEKGVANTFLNDDDVKAAQEMFDAAPNYQEWELPGEKPGSPPTRYRKEGDVLWRIDENGEISATGGSRKPNVLAFGTPVSPDDATEITKKLVQQSGRPHGSLGQFYDAYKSQLERPLAKGGAGVNNGIRMIRAGAEKGMGAEEIWRSLDADMKEALRQVASDHAMGPMAVLEHLVENPDEPLKAAERAGVDNLATKLEEMRPEIPEGARPEDIAELRQSAERDAQDILVQAKDEQLYEAMDDANRSLVDRGMNPEAGDDLAAKEWLRRYPEPPGSVGEATPGRKIADRIDELMAEGKSRQEAHQQAVNEAIDRSTVEGGRPVEPLSKGRERVDTSTPEGRRKVLDRLSEEIGQMTEPRSAAEEAMQESGKQARVEWGKLYDNVTEAVAAGEVSQDYWLLWDDLDQMRSRTHDFLLFVWPGPKRMRNAPPAVWDAVYTLRKQLYDADIAIAREMSRALESGEARFLRRMSPADFLERAGIRVNLDDAGRLISIEDINQVYRKSPLAYDDAVEKFESLMLRDAPEGHTLADPFYGRQAPPAAPGAGPAPSGGGPVHPPGPKAPPPPAPAVPTDEIAERGFLMQDVATADVKVSPDFQPRDVSGDPMQVDNRRIRELAKQWDWNHYEPIKVNVVQNDAAQYAGDVAPGDMVVMGGHHRLGAAREAGIDALPAQLYTLPYDDAKYVANIDNMVRQDQTAFEKGQIFASRIGLGDSETDLARVVYNDPNKAGMVAKYASLNELTPDVGRMVGEYPWFTESHGFALADAVIRYDISPEAQQQIVTKYMTEIEPSVTMLRQFLETYGPKAQKAQQLGLFSINETWLTDFAAAQEELRTLRGSAQSAKRIVNNPELAEQLGVDIEDAKKVVQELQDKEAELRRISGLDPSAPVSTQNVAEKAEEAFTVPHDTMAVSPDKEVVVNSSDVSKVPLDDLSEDEEIIVHALGGYDTPGWEHLRKYGATDEDIKDILSDRFGISGGAGKVAWQGGANPRVWYGIDATQGAPTYQGKRLIDWVREHLDIPTKEDALKALEDAMPYERATDILRGDIGMVSTDLTERGFPQDVADAWAEWSRAKRDLGEARAANKGLSGASDLQYAEKRARGAGFQLSATLKEHGLTRDEVRAALLQPVGGAAPEAEVGSRISHITKGEGTVVEVLEPAANGADRVRVELDSGETTVMQGSSFTTVREEAQDEASRAAERIREATGAPDAGDIREVEPEEIPRPEHAAPSVIESEAVGPARSEPRPSREAERQLPSEQPVPYAGGGHAPGERTSSGVITIAEDYLPQPGEYVSRDYLQGLRERTKSYWLSQGLSEAEANKKALQLMEHQVDNVNRAMTAFDRGHGFVIADSTGTGKTYSAAGIIDQVFERGGDRVVVVAPSRSILSQWGDILEPMGIRMEGFATKEGLPRAIPSADRGVVYGTTYASMNQWGKREPYAQAMLDMLGGSKADLVIFDESHFLKNWYQGTKTAEVGVGLSRAADHTVYMSATALESPLHYGYLAEDLGEGGIGTFDDMLSMLGIDKVEREVEYTTRGGRRATRTYETYEGVTPEKLAELNTMLVQNGSYVRHEMSYSGIANEQTGELLHAYASSVPVQVDDDLAKMYQDFHRVANKYSSGKFQSQIEAQRTAIGRAILENAKIPEAVQIAEKKLGEGKSVALFVWRKEGDNWEKYVAEFLAGERKYAEGSPIPAFYQDLLDAGIEIKSPIAELQARFPDAKVISGDVTGKARQAAIDAFNDGRTNVIIVTIDAGGVGLSLHDLVGEYPRVQINLTTPYTALSMDQVAGRTFRMGSQSNAELYWLYVDTPLEKKYINRTMTRSEKMGALIGGHESLVNDDDLLDFTFALDDATTSSAYSDLPMTLQETGPTDIDRFTTPPWEKPGWEPQYRPGYEPDKPNVHVPPEQPVVKNWPKEKDGRVLLGESPVANAAFYQDPETKEIYRLSDPGGQMRWESTYGGWDGAGRKTWFPEHQDQVMEREILAANAADQGELVGKLREITDAQDELISQAEEMKARRAPSGEIEKVNNDIAAIAEEQSRIVQQLGEDPDAPNVVEKILGGRQSPSIDTPAESFAKVEHGYRRVADRLNELPAGTRMVVDETSFIPKERAGEYVLTDVAGDKFWRHTETGEYYSSYDFRNWFIDSPSVEKALQGEHNYVRIEPRTAEGKTIVQTEAGPQVSMFSDAVDAPKLTLETNEMQQAWKLTARKNGWLDKWGEDAETYERFIRVLEKDRQRIVNALGEAAAEDVDKLIEEAKAAAEVIQTSFGKQDAFFFANLPWWQRMPGERAMSEASTDAVAQYHAAMNGLDTWEKWLLDEQNMIAPALSAEQKRSLENWAREAMPAKQQVRDVAQSGGELLGKAHRGAEPETLDAMVNYAIENNLISILKHPMPFIKFPAYSIPWWIETVATHPEILAWWMKYRTMSERYAFQHGAIDSNGQQLNRLRGYVPIPGTDLWWNPTAPISAKVVMPNDRTVYGIEEKNDQTPLQKAVNFLYGRGRLFGFNPAPWYEHVLLRGTGLLDTERYPAQSIAPVFELVPPWWQRSLLTGLRKTVYPNAPDLWEPQVSWKDYLVEQQLLEDAYQAVLDVPQEERFAVAQKYEQALLDREESQMYRDARHRVEQEDYYTRLVGFFTGVYAKPFTDGEAEMLKMRNDINFLRESIDSQVNATVFGLLPDANRRRDQWIDKRFNTGKGLLYNALSTTRWTVVPGQGQLHGEERRKYIEDSITKDIATRAKLDEQGNAWDEFQSSMDALPTGAPFELKDPLYSELGDRLGQADARYPEATDFGVPGEGTTMTDDQLRDYWVGIWYDVLLNTKPSYKPGEDFTEYEKRVKQWEQDLPQIAEPLLRSFMRSVRGRPQPKEMPDFAAIADPKLIENFDMADDTPSEALDRVWQEKYYSEYWNSLEGLSGYERDLAEMNFKMRWPHGPDDETLIKWVQQRYGDQFTRKQLLDVLRMGGTLDIDQRLAIGRTEMENQAEQIWTLMNWAGPSKNKLEQAYIAAGGDPDFWDYWWNSDGHPEAFPEADWNRFYETMMLAGNSLDLGKPSRDTVEEWAYVQGVNTEYGERAKMLFGQEIFSVSSAYSQTPYSQREQYRQEHPELKAFWDFRDKWTVDHPLWAQYYRPYALENAKVQVASKARSYSGGGGGGGGSSATRRTNYRIAPTGYRSSLDTRELAAGKLGTGGYAGLIDWPANTPEELKAKIPPELQSEIASEEPLSEAAQNYLSVLWRRHPEWRKSLGKILGIKTPETTPPEGN